MTTEETLERNQDQTELSEMEVSTSEEKVSGDQEVVTPTLTLEEQIAQAKAEWLASDEFKTAVQTEKDKSIYREIQQQVQPLQDKIRELDQAKQEAVLAAQEGRELEFLGDTDEVKDFQRKRRDVVSREAKITQYEEYWGRHYKRGEAALVAAEYGVEVKDLLEANSPEELRVKAQALQGEKRANRIKELEKELAQVKKPPQTIDSGAKTVAGVDYDKMSAVELIQHGIDKQKRK